MLTSFGYDPTVCANKLGAFVQSNNLDGVDIDWEDNDAMKKGLGEAWLITFSQILRSLLPNHIISHAPQAPYFNPNIYPNGGYKAIHDQVGNTIDFYNVQFYNQGDTTYDTYDSLFIDSGHLNPETAIYQMMARGVEPGKIVLGKPVTEADAYNTGFIKGSDLNSLLLEAKKDKRNKGWKPSVMFWHYLSDLDGKNIAAVMKDV